MRIKVVNSITDENGMATPKEMIGKEYDVIKEEANGVWVRAEGKLDAFVYYDELEITQLDTISPSYEHYLRNASKEEYQQIMESKGFNHLL